jgi:Tfp pilus tip-associated adhesin PilY1
VLAATTPASGTSTAIGLTSAQLSSTGSFGYLTTSPDTNWSGDVLKFELDPNTGLLKNGSTGKPEPIWSASSQLDLQAAGTTGQDSSRRIVTINDSGTGVPFRFRIFQAPKQDF